MPGGGQRRPLVMVRARALATHRDDHALLPLPVLALLIGVICQPAAVMGDSRRQTKLMRGKRKMF